MRESCSKAMWEHCQQGNATQRTMTHNWQCAGQTSSFSSFLHNNLILKDLTSLVLGEKVMVTQCNELWSKHSAQRVKHFISQRYNIRENRQRKAATVIYLCQLLFNNASVLQCDWLLFGALCCQHLACRAKHIAGEHSQGSIRVLTDAFGTQQQQ